MTATEKSKIESYLAVKYGLTLTHDYQASDATVTWNVTTNAAYNNRVTGISRDNTTGLDQRKSLSALAGAVVTMDKGGAFATDKSFLLWGDNNAALAASAVPDFPAGAGLIGRIARAWKLAQTGPVGAVATRFDISSIPGPKNAADLRLLVDRNKNGIFADETIGGGVISGAIDLGGGVFEFAGISYNDGELISLGTVSSSTPLPITLISFTATPVEGTVKVAWSTATEVNNDYFIVQRSLDGIEFKQVAKVPGAGNSHDLRKYLFVDETPATGLNYYRLKQIDYDGKSTLTTILAVNVIPETISWNVYPNPASREFTIEGRDLDNAEVILTNSTGQRVTITGTQRSGKLVVETSQLPRGMYLITIRREGTVTSKKIILD